MASSIEKSGKKTLAHDFTIENMVQNAFAHDFTIETGCKNAFAQDFAVKKCSPALFGPASQLQNAKNLPQQTYPLQDSRRDREPFMPCGLM